MDDQRGRADALFPSLPVFSAVCDTVRPQMQGVGWAHDSEAEGVKVVQAGRDLDALVAEKVMGWRWSGRYLVPPADVETSFWDGSCNRDGVPRFLPRYSTDISAAWGVVEKLRDEVAFLDILPAADHYIVKIQSAHGTDYVTAETAPLAICLAALKVKGVDVD